MDSVKQVQNGAKYKIGDLVVHPYYDSVWRVVSSQLDSQNKKWHYGLVLHDRNGDKNARDTFSSFQINLKKVRNGGFNSLTSDNLLRGMRGGKTVEQVVYKIPKDGGRVSRATNAEIRALENLHYKDALGMLTVGRTLHGKDFYFSVNKEWLPEYAKNPSSREVAKCKKILSEDADEFAYIASVPISAGFDWERNPMQEYIIFDVITGKAIQTGKFDKLTDIVDRSNDVAGYRRYFVLSREDFLEAQKTYKDKRNGAAVANPKQSKYYYEKAPAGMTEYAINAYNAIAKGMSSQEFYYGKNKHLVGDYDQYAAIVEKHPHRLFKKNGAVKNESASDFKRFTKDRLIELSKMFQGKASGARVRVLSPDSLPNETWRLGYLVQMKIRHNGKVTTINFDGESYLSGDLRCNLWAVGKDARITNIRKPSEGQLKKIGKLIQVDYVTAKKHIEGGKVVRFWHPLGEVNKDYPTLYIDHDGFPIILGGGYDIWNVGIVN